MRSGKWCHHWFSDHAMKRSLVNKKDSSLTLSLQLTRSNVWRKLWARMQMGQKRESDELINNSGYVHMIIKQCKSIIGNLWRALSIRLDNNHNVLCFPVFLFFCTSNRRNSIWRLRWVRCVTDFLVSLPGSQQPLYFSRTALNRGLSQCLSPLPPSSPPPRGVPRCLLPLRQNFDYTLRNVVHICSAVFTCVWYTAVLIYKNDNCKLVYIVPGIVTSWYVPAWMSEMVWYSIARQCSDVRTYR